MLSWLRSRMLWPPCSVCAHRPKREALYNRRLNRLLQHKIRTGRAPSAFSRQIRMSGTRLTTTLPTFGDRLRMALTRRLITRHLARALGSAGFPASISAFPSADGGEGGGGDGGGRPIGIRAQFSLTGPFS